MPGKTFGKYKSRRKKKITPQKPKKVEEGAGLLGDIGSGMNEIGKFVEKSGKAVTDVTSKIVSAGGDAVHYIGTQIKDKKVSKGFKDVGKTMSGTAKDVVNFLGKASPYIGKAGQWVGDKMMKGDSDYNKKDTGGGIGPNWTFDTYKPPMDLHEKFKFDDHMHAAKTIKHMSDEHHKAIRAAAKFITNKPLTIDDPVILHHRPDRHVPLKHFDKIVSSTKDSLHNALLNDKDMNLTSAVQTSAHSAHLGGGIEFNHRRHHMHHDERVFGGSFFDEVGKRFGHAAVLAGKIGVAASPVVTLIAPELGVPLAAVSAATVGIGAAVNEAYGEKTKIV